MVERAISNLSDEQFFTKPGDAVNSVALIIKHMAGNLQSRWLDFLTADGEKPTRDRDREFILAGNDTRGSLMQGWQRGWSMLENTLGRLRDEDLGRRVTIRRESLTVLQALLRAATHAAHHTGQVLYLSRLLCPGAPWLTIAPGTSGEFVPPSLRKGRPK